MLMRWQSTKKRVRTLETDFAYWVVQFTFWGREKLFDSTLRDKLFPSRSVCNNINYFSHYYYNYYFGHESVCRHDSANFHLKTHFEIFKNTVKNKNKNVPNEIHRVISCCSNCILTYSNFGIRELQRLSTKICFYKWNFTTSWLKRISKDSQSLTITTGCVVCYCNLSITVST